MSDKFVGALINVQRDGKPSPRVGEIARAVGISDTQTKCGVGMLERYEILKKDNWSGCAGYSVLPQSVRWE